MPTQTAVCRSVLIGGKASLRRGVDSWRRQRHRNNNQNACLPAAALFLFLQSVRPNARSKPIKSFNSALSSIGDDDNINNTTIPVNNNNGDNKTKTYDTTNIYMRLEREIRMCNCRRNSASRSSFRRAFRLSLILLDCSS